MFFIRTLYNTHILRSTINYFQDTRGIAHRAKKLHSPLPLLQLVNFYPGRNCNKGRRVQFLCTWSTRLIADTAIILIKHLWYCTLHVCCGRFQQKIHPNVFMYLIYGD